MKKLYLCILMVFAAAAFSGCAASPPDALIRQDTDPSSLINAGTDQLAADSVAASLYFRYEDTAYLAAEERQISVERNQTLEKALVEALIQGPSVTASALSPLFPPGTQVISVSSQGDTLFVTFNEALLSRYSDEPKDLTAGNWRVEAPLRRKLCMDSLTATLTEMGLCARVQVLVYRENIQSTSMRLPQGYFTGTEDETLVSFLTRNEDTLLTPHNAAQVLMNAWLQQDWNALYAITHTAGRPGEQEAVQAFSSSRVLTGFTLSPGNVSIDGKTAILTAEISLMDQQPPGTSASYPIRLSREGGIWKMEYHHLNQLMNQN